MSVLRDVRLHASYAWRNSGSKAVLLAHTAWENRLLRNRPWARSVAGGLTFDYTGIAEGLAYTLDFMEEQRTQATSTVKRSMTWSRRGAREVGLHGDVDLELVGLRRAAAHVIAGQHSVVFPMRVHFLFDLSRPQRSEISRRELQLHRKSSLSNRWRMIRSTSADDFYRFFDSMYVPTMVMRHGPHARTEARDSAYECIFKEGALLLLWAEDELVGGTVCHWNRRIKTLTLRLVGVLNGDARHYSDGAFKAIYHCLIAWAKEEDIDFLDFQGTEAFLSKGTFQWKRRVSSNITLPPNHYKTKRVCLTARIDSPGLRAFLVANPIICESASGSLLASYFYDETRPARTDLAWKCGGIDGEAYLHLDEFLRGLPTRVESA